MKKYTLILIAFVLGFVSCSKDDPQEPCYPDETEQTLFLYMPWSSNLTSFFEQNIADFETAIRDNVLKNNRIIVFFSISSTEATMFEMAYENGKNVRIPLKEYVNPAFTTSQGIALILQDVINFAPANRYAMVVGSHGMGWLPVNTRSRMALGDTERYHWEYEDVPLTRYFGGTTSDVQTDITTLAEAISDVGIKMDYILFDDCYMSSIEVAYDLKDVTDHLIASPTEVMVYGFPYHLVGKHLIGNYNLKGVCEGFYSFYENYKYPYGTIGVTVTAELDNLAAIMKEINQNYLFDDSLVNDIQRMDGYSPIIFFDMGDYVSMLCEDPVLLAKFNQQFERTVPPDMSLHTRSYYSMSRGSVDIYSFSGVTISDPSISTKAVAKTETAWYKATH